MGFQNQNADYFYIRLQTLFPLNIEKKIDTMKFKGLFNPSQLTLQRFACIKC